jgi:putative DNA primase/helicase
MISVKNIPQEMKDRRQWVCWRYEERDGKKTKVPINARTGKLASSTNPKTWNSFNVAVRRYNKSANYEPISAPEANDLVDGIGFVFNNDYIGVDLDHILTEVDGTPAWKPWAQDILKNCPDTYAEYSPSGEGLHVIFRGRLPGKGLSKNVADGKIEIYSAGRYFTVTGLRHSNFDITDDCASILELYNTFAGSNGANRKSKSTLKRTDIGTDDHLEVALKDPVFSRLWSGDISANNNDDSAADLALCNKIVFYFGADADVVDRVFRQSKLYREKWERADYRQWTISKAIEGTTESYEPKRKPPKTGQTESRAEARNAPINDSAEKNSEDEAPKPPASLKNAVRTIEECHLANLWFDDFLNRPMTGDPPHEWTDQDDRELCIRLQSVRGFSKIGLETVANAALTVAFRKRKNCVKDWLKFLRWDEEPRIDHFFEDHFGAVGTQYTRSASRNFWISMVARAEAPGCKVDNMVVFEGGQGKKKSSALDIIGGAWFAEQHENVTSREFFQVLQGKLLIEISELDAFSRSDVTKVKQVVSCRSDRYREPYGRHAKDHPRQCVFVGTTNKDDWNRDETGARRFWPIACHGEIDLDAIRANRDQCFAEALHRYKAGEPWWEMPIEETETEQASRYIAPAWAEPIETYIHQERVWDGYSNKWKAQTRLTPLEELSVAEILEHALDIPKAQWNKAAEMRVGEALRYLGWTKKNVRHGVRIVKRWVLPPQGSYSAKGGNA